MAGRNAAGVARALRAHVDRVSNAIADVVLAEVEAGTPVDTGEAREAWKVTHGKVTAGAPARVTTEVEYMPYLNRGSSPQAPARFVQAAVRSAIRKVENS
jgi:hypothetical protein